MLEKQSLEKSGSKWQSQNEMVSYGVMVTINQSVYQGVSGRCGKATWNAGKVCMGLNSCRFFSGKVWP